MHSPDHRAGTIETLLHEERKYPPSHDFTAQANISDSEVYKRAEEDPEGFWREAATRIDWFKEPTRVLDWDPPFAKWFAYG
jgi:acetyl-CoA synthetase